jgi:hypothetical protein
VTSNVGNGRMSNLAVCGHFRPEMTSSFASLVAILNRSAGGTFHLALTVQRLSVLYDLVGSFCM